MKFQNKYYLNGIDWVNNALCYQCRRTPAAGNCFAIALELQGQVSIEHLSRLQHSFNNLLPLLNGHIKRQRLHLAPYWASRCSPRLLPEFDCRRVTDKDINSERQAYLNQPFTSDRHHLAARCLITDTHTTLLCKFDHRLFDGRGGEMLLAALQESWQKNRPLHCVPPGGLSPQLSEWQEKFDSGKRINRWLKDLKQGPPLLTFTDGDRVTGAPNCFRTLQLSTSQTKALFKHAEALLGPFMTTPYLAAIVVTSLIALAKERGQESPYRIVLPMTVDLRGTAEAAEQIFFNRWSIAPLLVECDHNATFPTIAQHCKKEFINIYRCGFMHDIRNANLLTRIIPLPIFARISNHIFAGTAGTASFAFISEPAFSGDKFMEYPLQALYHLPTMPPRPGIGIFMTNYRQRLTVTLSYRQGVIANQEATSLMQQLKALLKNEKLCQQL